LSPETVDGTVWVVLLEVLNLVSKRGTCSTLYGGWPAPRTNLLLLQCGWDACWSPAFMCCWWLASFSTAVAVLVLLLLRAGCCYGFLHCMLGTRLCACFLHGGHSSASCAVRESIVSRWQALTRFPVGLRNDVAHHVHGVSIRWQAWMPYWLCCCCAQRVLLMGVPPARAAQVPHCILSWQEVGQPGFALK